MVIGSRYRLVAPIGRGAMAEVWRAEHVTLGTPFAVKLVTVSPDAKGASTLERFLREAQAAARLRGPNIVQIFDHGTEGQGGYIAMELLDGESLRDRLDRCGRLAARDVARIVSQLARGLDLAHAAGLVHRDLKPQNVMIAREQGRELVKILDFGIAKRIDLGGLDRLASHEGIIVGTPCYMSPEQIMGSRPVDARSDIWQLGVIAFECVCGSRPFEAAASGELLVDICSKPAPVPSQRCHVSAGFDEWFARAVAKDPNDRFASAAELAEALCTVLVPGTGAAALAEASAPWIPAASGSCPGVLQSGNYPRPELPPGRASTPGVAPASPPPWVAGSSPTTADPAHAPGARGHVLLVILLLALAVAGSATAAGLWVLSKTEPAQPSSVGSTDATATASALPGADATPTAGADAADGAAAPAAPATAATGDAGLSAEHRPPAPFVQPGKPATTTTAPSKGTRRQRPEDVLGI